ncbi:SCO7613 C-terminal domain-containing membrane protein [Streptomyces lienomycini]|uniref:SCO7613 C-terminal domain-containing membrane protein n=1 Tax=Streptomyces lienomycini TaxID=284035 RepID=A0ABV9WJN6_9ACTN
MTNLPPPAEELRVLDAELRQLDARRAVLLRRREWLVHTLRAAAAPGPGSAPSGPVPAHAGAVAPRPEVEAPGVQNVLLVLGGVLLTVAAIAFTLVSWGHLGIAGRALVLGALTAGALGVPVALLRRGLRSTAEAVSALATALTVLDAYALHEVAFPGTSGPGYTAGASAVLAATWAAYGVGAGRLTPSSTARSEPSAGAGPAAADGSHGAGALPGLRHPLPLAVATAHLPALLWAVAFGAGPHTLTAVLLATAAAGTAVALRTALAPVRVVAVVGALGTGGAGVLTAAWLCWSASGPQAAARAALLLVLAAAVALVTGRFVPRAGIACGAALVAGLCPVTGAGGVLRAALPGEWTVPGCLACGIALLAAVRSPLPRPVRQGLVRASLTVQGLALLWSVPLVAGSLLGPVAWSARSWSGAPQDIRDAVFSQAPWPPYAGTVPLVLAVVAGALTVAARRGDRHPAAAVGALVLGWASLFVLPAVLELPYGAGLVAQAVVVAAALGFAQWSFRARRGQRLLPLTALLLALVTAVGLAFLALASETATIGVLAAMTALFGAAGFLREVAPWAAPAALGHAAALACATGASADWPPHRTALLVLVVPVVAALLAARRTTGPRATVGVEVAGTAAALLALALAVTHPPMLAAVLSVCGVVAAGTALRPERRPAVHASAALFLLAAWVRLAAWDVTTPEAYTLPVTVPALVVGLLARRRDAGLSSWTAYGAGLSITLVPSLFAAWRDLDWTRPLLLGTAALAVTLTGARYRLRAPLLLGGGVLALVTLHELAPYLAQVVGALPRWAPLALAGLVLLVLGATYEQRLRDARRLRDAFGRLH